MIEEPGSRGPAAEATISLEMGGVGAEGGAGGLRTPRAGAVIAGRYRLLRELGHGGFGRVWEADDTLTGEIVAVKLLPLLGRRELALVRRELTALRRARLPGVVQLRDDGPWGGLWFLVMDRVQGAPFPGPGPTPRAWDGLRPVAIRLLAILARIHHAGILHLDLKPSNVLVGPGDQPVVLDFGVARGRALSEVTGAGFHGTIRYASPEQAALRPPDARSDLFSVGVLLYEALSGCWTHDGRPTAMECWPCAGIGPASR